MKHTVNILNRWSSSVIFTAEVEADESASLGFRLGLAIKIAYGSRADLRDADLSDADLHDADLRDADLSGAVLRRADLRDADLRGAVLRDADLRDADLRDADLRGAVLRSFKADFWMILTQNRAEVPGLINALCDGRVNGSTYHGECACLVGTIANVRGVAVETLDRNSGRPAEQWFLMIKEGDKPGDDSGGGFANRTAVTWALEWCALNGITAQGEWTAAVKLAEPVL